MLLAFGVGPRSSDGRAPPGAANPSITLPYLAAPEFSLTTPRFIVVVFFFFQRFSAAYIPHCTFPEIG